MGKETERKFLVNAEFRHLSTHCTEIIQTYLVSDDKRTVRLRIADNKAFITIKGRPEPGEFSRNEWEYEIPVEDAREMLPLSLPGKIIKTRYHVPSKTHVIEVDVFHDKNEGLILAEIELASEDEVFEKPDWLGEELTGKAEYYNSNLRK
jgi:adenylate cyclase